MTHKLLSWYHKNKRDLPWRKTLNPYKIWVSEIILQQTQIKTGIKYYRLFIKKFPNIKALANADEIEVLNAWQGLGYYNRALNMLTSAKKVITEHNGVFPSKYIDLIKLKGVGEYTASAISSICSNEKRAVLDGNVYRFLSRLYNIDTPINTYLGQKKFQKIATQLMPNKHCGTYNQAIMEFGSIHCEKRSPKCVSCPFQSNCKSFKLSLIKLRPVKNTRIIKKIRYLNYFLIKENEEFIIQQRNINDIWQKLYELPLIESSQKLTEAQLIKHKYLRSFRVNSITNVFSMNHILSHQKLKIIFWNTKTKRINIPTKFKKITISQISNYPFPVPLKKYFDKEHLNV